MGGSTTGNYALYGAALAAAIALTVASMGTGAPAIGVVLGSMATAAAQGAVSGAAIGAIKQYGFEEPEKKRKESDKEDAIAAEALRVENNNKRAKSMYFRETSPAAPTQVSDIMAGKNNNVVQQPTIKNAPAVTNASVLTTQRTAPSNVGV